MKTFSVLLLIFTHIVLFSSDTLLISSKRGEQERILLFGERYWIKCNLISYRTSFYKVRTNYIEYSAGIYYEKDSMIYFRNPPLTDSIKNDYYVWPAGRAGPSLVTDSEKLVQFLFNESTKIEFTMGEVSLPFYGELKRNGIIKLRGKKIRRKSYQITAT